MRSLFLIRDILGVGSVVVKGGGEASNLHAESRACNNELSWNFQTFYGGQEPSRNRVIVPARHAT